MAKNSEVLLLDIGKDIVSQNVNMTFRYYFVALINSDLFIFCVSRAFSYSFYTVYLTLRLVFFRFTCSYNEIYKLSVYYHF